MFQKFKPFQASPVFSFKDPDTGHPYNAKSLGSLYKDIILYREQNNLEPIENLNLVVENYLCGLPENCNSCEERPLGRTLWQYVQGGMLLLKNIVYKEYAPQEVAEKRALQCSTCEFNINPDRGAFEQWADGVAIAQVGDRKTSLDSKLFSCVVCSCVLRGKVHYGGTLPKFSDEQRKKFEKVSCWNLGLEKK